MCITGGYCIIDPDHTSHTELGSPEDVHVEKEGCVTLAIAGWPTLKKRPIKKN